VPRRTALADAMRSTSELKQRCANAPGALRVRAYIDFFKATHDECTQTREPAALLAYTALLRDLEAALRVNDVYGPLPEGMRARLLTEYDRTCAYCGGKGTPTHGSDRRSWHTDHVVPRSRGGTNDDDNVVLACATCNLRKRDKEGWQPSRRSVTHA
jgi:HNH endonuclease